jgi:ribonucleoside-diphosphate reductase alpha chain
MINYLEELSNFVFTSKYARYNEKLGRRESWEEAIKRLENMYKKKYSYLPEKDWAEINWAFDMIRAKRIVPSMRSLQFGGKAIEAHEPRIYNCAVRHVDSLRAFAEIFYLLLCGNGVGIGLSNTFLARLPNLVNAKDKTGTVITYAVEDTIEGWADSMEALLNCYFKNTPYTGRKIVFDYSKIRAAGTPLKTGGGKAPGYRGLKNAHKKVKLLLDHVIEDLHQTRLKSINAYDILMHAADAVLSGGIRRSATSVVFDKDDLDLTNAKTFFNVIRKGKFEQDSKTKKYEGYVILEDPAYPGKQKVEVEMDEWAYNDLQQNQRISWFYVYPHRARSNNSVLLLRDSVTTEEFKTIYERTKEFGEPGFVFANHPWTLFNPCFEIGFIPVTEDGVCGVQFCNLTSINGAKVHSLEDYLECAKAATIIGTLQATYTTFPYLSPAATKLTAGEALLGVSITGMMDNPQILLNPNYQKEAAELVIKTNSAWSKKLGINQAARVTCIKPEGTGSLVLGSASGIHAHHAKPRFFRRVQVNKYDPVYQYFKTVNPHMTEESVWSANKTDDVITFPVEITDTALVKSDLDALKHLEIIKTTQQNWVVTGTTPVNRKGVTHNVSCTVVVNTEEWDKVRDYLYDNKNYFAAVSLLAHTGDKDFKQAPLEAVTTEEDKKLWDKIIADFKPVNYKGLKEGEDQTALQQELVCAGGQCELPILSNQ